MWQVLYCEVGAVGPKMLLRRCAVCYAKPLYTVAQCGVLTRRMYGNRGILGPSVMFDLEFV